MAKRIALRVMVFALCIILACVIKLGKGERLTAIRERASALIGSHADYEGATETLGRAVAGEAPEDGENAVVVFGRMLLGLTEDTP